jgi:hypothetical protein
MYQSGGRLCIRAGKASGGTESSNPSLGIRPAPSRPLIFRHFLKSGETSLVTWFSNKKAQKVGAPSPGRGENRPFRFFPHCEPQSRLGAGFRHGAVLIGPHDRRASSEGRVGNGPHRRAGRLPTDKYELAGLQDSFEAVLIRLGARAKAIYSTTHVRAISFGPKL